MPSSATGIVDSAAQGRGDLIGSTVNSDGSGNCELGEAFIYQAANLFYGAGAVLSDQPFSYTSSASGAARQTEYGSVIWATRAAVHQCTEETTWTVHRCAWPIYIQKSGSWLSATGFLS